MTQPTRCDHLDFEAHVDVDRIEDGTAGEVVQFMASLTIRCVGCGAPFGFRGPPAGMSYRAPRCKVDALGISLPLMSPAELALAGPLPAIGRGPMGYEVDP